MPCKQISPETVALLSSRDIEIYNNLTLPPTAHASWINFNQLNAALDNAAEGVHRSDGTPPTEVTVIQAQWALRSQLSLNKK